MLNSAVKLKQKAPIDGEAGKEKYEKGTGYAEFDMDYCDLQTDINVCEVEQMITSEEAWRLREQYLGLQKG